MFIAFGGNIDGLGVSAEEVIEPFAIYLSLVYPNPAIAGWGWSRVGWNWQSWWQYAERCVGGLEPERGLDVLASVLKHIQEREGSPLAEVQAFVDGSKLDRAVSRLMEL